MIFVKIAKNNDEFQILIFRIKDVSKYADWTLLILQNLGKTYLDQFSPFKKYVSTLSVFVKFCRFGCPISNIVLWLYIG